MKGTNRSWRAQKGSVVEYAVDRTSGKAVVVHVVEEAQRFKLRDVDTGVVFEASVEQIRMTKTR